MRRSPGRRSAPGPLLEAPAILVRNETAVDFTRPLAGIVDTVHRNPRNVPGVAPHERIGHNWVKYRIDRVDRRAIVMVCQFRHSFRFPVRRDWNQKVEARAAPRPSFRQMRASLLEVNRVSLQPPYGGFPTSTIQGCMTCVYMLISRQDLRAGLEPSRTDFPVGSLRYGSLCGRQDTPIETHYRSARQSPVAKNKPEICLRGGT